MWGNTETFDLEIRSDSAIIFNSLEGFNFGETDFEGTWRTDVYDNHYFVSENKELVHIVPGSVLEKYSADEDDFSEFMKHNLAYLTNFTELESHGVQVPDFQTGVHVSKQRAIPYTVMERPEGIPLSKVSRLLDGDREENLRDDFDRYNEIGRELAGSNRIIYPSKRSNNDLIVCQEEGDKELVYINPGTYIRDAFYNQFQKNRHVPSNSSNLGDWLGGSYWEERIMD